VGLHTLTSTFDLASSAAKAAEKNGFASVWCPDHIICPPEYYGLVGVDSVSFEILETWTTLTAVAVQTKKVMLGTAVSPVPRYNPAFLAKIVTTLDVISKGRTILGVGAGYHKPEFEMHDFPWKPVESHVNTEEHYVWAIIDHFSLFTIMGQPSEAAASSPTQLWFLAIVGVVIMIVIAVSAIYIRKRKTAITQQQSKVAKLTSVRKRRCVV